MATWFEELLSKTNGSDFDHKNTADSFEVIVHEGDKVYAEWDITKELLENGMSRKHFFDADLNLDVELFFMHKLKHDESFKNLLERADNASKTFEFNGTTSGYNIMDGGLYSVTCLFYIQGVLTLLIGLVGSRASSQKGVVKVTRVTHSIWCIIVGILTIVPALEYSRDVSLQFSADLFWFVIRSLVAMLLKVFVMSLKVFTVIIYGFQNTMLYRPFYFREHRKAFSRWLLRISLGQTVSMFATFVGWSMILLFKFQKSCNGIETRAASWQKSLILVTTVGYVGSLFLCIIFLIGYCKNNTKDVGKSDTKNIKKTMISCSIEILFDLIVLVTYVAAPIDCFSMNFDAYGIEQTHISTHCDLFVRFLALDVGLSRCSVAILILQPTIQELFFLISELVDHCSKDKA